MVIPVLRPSPGIAKQKPGADLLRSSELRGTDLGPSSHCSISPARIPDSASQDAIVKEDQILERKSQLSQLTKIEIDDVGFSERIEKQKQNNSLFSLPGQS